AGDGDRPAPDARDRARRADVRRAQPGPRCGGNRAVRRGAPRLPRAGRGRRGGRKGRTVMTTSYVLGAVRTPRGRRKPGKGTLDLVVAGGVESMSRVPMGSDGAGEDGGNTRLRERFFQVPQGISADLIATLENFSREEVDEIAYRSQRRAARAVEERRFAGSLVPVADPITGKLVLERDELLRPDTTREGLAGLAPAFVALGGTAAGPNGETLDQDAAAGHPEARQKRPA